MSEHSGFKAIRDWREDEKPRERLMKHGASTLSDAELLAILIAIGTRGRSALDLSKELLEKNENLTKLASCELGQIQSIQGIGMVKAVTLAAAFEIGKRIETEPFNFKSKINSPEVLSRFYIPRFRGSKKETFMALLLNSSNQIIKEQIISIGTLNASIVHPREVFRQAIIEAAASIILVHNHPSGNPTPSNEDISVTKTLIEVGNIIDIKVLDHLIIAGETYTSFVKRGLLSF